MKFLFDIFPILLFFIVFKFFGIFVATAAAIAASVLQVAYMYARNKKVEPMLLINFAVIAFFGGLTLLLHNELFIKWKPTVLYGLFAAILFISDRFYNQNLLKVLMRSGIRLEEKLWSVMNYSWVIFFALLSILNIIVAYSFPTETWVNFKLFGLVGLTVLFVVGQSIYLARHIRAEDVLEKK